MAAEDIIGEKRAEGRLLQLQDETEYSKARSRAEAVRMVMTVAEGKTALEMIPLPA